MSLDADLRLQRGSLHVDVAMRVEPGETVVLLGPNGAGKTTLLGALAGLVPIEHGHIALDDHVLDSPERDTWVPTERRSIGFVYQDHLLFPHLTATDNVAFGLRSRGARRSDARRQAREWLDRMGLADYKDARPSQLSGGQAQRVALARALASEPRLLLLDEPLAALDATTRLDVRRDLRRHLDDFDGPRLVVTHDPIDAMALADRVLVLEHGQITQTGTLAQLRAQPRSRYVADLVGVNLYQGHMDHDDVRLSDGRELRTTNDRQITDEVFVVIRPGAVALYRTQPEGSPRNTWPGAIDAIDQTNDVVRVHLDGKIPITAEITQAALEDLELKIGAPAWASVKATEVELYPA